MVPFCFTGVCGNFKLAPIYFYQTAEVTITIGTNEYKWHKRKRQRRKTKMFLKCILKRNV